MKTLLYIFILYGLFLQVRSNESIKYYSRSSAEWKTMNVTEEQSLYASPAMDEGEGLHVPLEYGINYKGVGQLSTPLECARPCEKGAEPKNCYYHFTVELYRTQGGACRICRPTTNTSLSSDCQCIEADGVDLSGIMIVNRMFPGPSIQLCLGDRVIVDVHNKAVGSAITIHWHGMYQKNSQHYDGVPFVTQCPITRGTTFRYKWLAHNAGTHFYHAHTGLHKPDGLEGAVVVRTPKSIDPNRDSYDEDNFDNIIFINDWFHESAVDHWPGTSTRNVGQIPKNLLINGKGRWFDPATETYTNSPLAVFNVKPNRRIRFRMINSLSWTCPVQLSIKDHGLTLIATDGEDVKPINATTINSFSAERYDFVINTVQKPDTYLIEVRLAGFCASQNVFQVALLNYVGQQLVEPKLDRPVSRPRLPLGVVFNGVNDVCVGATFNNVCLKHLQSANDINKRLLFDEPDVSILLPFQFYVFGNEELFQRNTYQNFQVPTGGNGSVAMLSNISNVFTGSPYLSQIGDIPSTMICNSTSKPERCLPGKPCFCSHIVDIPLNAVVDIITADVGPNGLSHPFHIHGYACHVMGQGLLKDVPITEQNKLQALRLHRNHYGDPHRRPVAKDTVATLSGGYTICRFIADNPGFWLYHCHFMSHLLVGMELVLRVGAKADLPPTPIGFPTCGDFAPKLN